MPLINYLVCGKSFRRKTFGTHLAQQKEKSIRTDAFFTCK
jgi:hypothetical protein